MIGAVFAHKEEMKELKLPMIVLTSSFGTVEMWDWEIVAYLREQLKLTIFTPYNTELGKVILRALSAKKGMESGRVNFLMFQDSPGEGMQANIFKRFYWWEAECRETIEKAFGIRIIYRSWKEVNEAAAQISDEAALKLWEERLVPSEGVTETAALKAVKIYMAVKAVIDEIGNVGGVGSNCLNESFHSSSIGGIIFAHPFEVVFHRAGCDTGITAGAQVQVDDHSPLFFRYGFKHGCSSLHW
jgi:hypothetical protein